MKKVCVLIMSILVFLLASSCSSEKNLLEISYDSPDTVISMTLEGGDKYICIGGTTSDVEKGDKVARVKGSEKAAYAYAVKGYDSNEFLIVEERMFMGNADRIYVRNDVENVPRKFFDILISEDKIQYNGKTYYNFREVKSSFKLGEELGQTTALVFYSIDSNNVHTPLEQPREVTAHLYRISDLSENDWIAVKKEQYLGKPEIYVAADIEYIPRKIIE